MNVTNQDRSEWAMAACRAFCRITGQGVDDELGPAIGDLIANLLHLADRNGWCADEILRVAQMHYEAERDCET